MKQIGEIFVSKKDLSFFYKLGKLDEENFDNFLRGKISGLKGVEKFGKIVRLDNTKEGFNVQVFKR